MKKSNEQAQLHLPQSNMKMGSKDGISAWVVCLEMLAFKRVISKILKQSVCVRVFGQ
jgi:hypothetical protein